MNGKNILITGGNNGEALALTKLLLSNNIRVFVLDKDISNLEKIDSTYLKYYKVDVSDEKSLQEISKDFKNIELTAIVLNAIEPFFCKAEENSPEVIEKVFSGGVYGTILCASIFFDYLKPKGRILFLNSTKASHNGIANESLHCAAKFAIRGFCESIKKACEKNSIYIQNIYTGSKNTEFWDEETKTMKVYEQVPKNLIDVDKLAKIILECITSENGGLISDIYVERCKDE